MAYVIRLAETKARAAAAGANIPDDQNALFLAGDTAVVQDGLIYGKPADDRAAWQMLSQLRGRTHQVHSGIAVFRPKDGQLVTEVCTTEVTMRLYTEAEMQGYIDSGDPLDKAGGYAIQHAGFNPVSEIKGCFANVTGLPLCRVAHCLALFDCLPDRPGGLSCQGPGEQACPVAAQIDQLSGQPE